MGLRDAYRAEESGMGNEPRSPAFDAEDESAVRAVVSEFAVVS